MTLALLCSGQGLQHPEMFRLVGDLAPAAPVFERARQLLGRDPRELVRTESTEVLRLDRIAQILCVSQALAAATCLRPLWPEKLLIAGYSVGELAAWGVAGLLDTESTLELAATRARLMDAASHPGDGLLSVRGLGRIAIDDLCRNSEASIAIINSGDAFVVGGTGDALRAFTAAATQQGAAHVSPIGVNVAAHTPRLKDASIRFRSALENISTLSAINPKLRLFHGVDGTSAFDPIEGKDKLARQICQTVHWTSCLESCVEAGATAFLELGPGSALSKILTHAYPKIPSRSLDDFRTTKGVASWIERSVRAYLP